MSKKLVLTTIITLVTITLNAQIKVWPSGYTAIGFTSVAPSTGFVLQVAGNSVFSATSSSITSAAYIRGLNGYSTVTTPDYTWWGNDQTGIFHPASSVIGFTNGGSEKMRIHSNGYIGINNTSPAYPLHVSGDINVGALTNAYRINGNIVLQQKNIASCIFVGNGAGASTTGSYNVATGYHALYSNASGISNSAYGYQALFTSTGNYNAAFGSGALVSNTGSYNCAFGTTHFMRMVQQH